MLVLRTPPGFQAALLAPEWDCRMLCKHVVFFTLSFPKLLILRELGGGFHHLGVLMNIVWM